MARKRYSKEIKEKVLELLKQGLRKKAISKQLGIGMTSVEYWQNMYDGGETGWVTSSYIPASSIYSELEKEQAVEAYRTETATKVAICRKMKISKNVLNCWIRNYNQYGVCNLKRGRRNEKEDEGRKEARRIQEEARRERDRSYLLESALPGLGRRIAEGTAKKKDFFKAVDRCRNLGIPITKILHAAGVPSSSYYYWRKHPEKESEEDQKLAEQIKAVQERNYWDYGAKTMAKQLVRSGHYTQINHKRVSRIMDKYGLHAKVRRRKYPKNYYRILRENPPELPKNVLNREFACESAGEKFVTDITYIPCDGGWCYLAAIKDLFNNEIVAWQMDEHISVDMTKKMVERLLTSGSIHAGSLLHSDQSWNYTHKSFVEFLSSKGITQSLSRRGNCWDNACMESFFSFLKADTFRQMGKLAKQLTFQNAKDKVRDYIHWYNNDRIQKKLGYKTPVEYLCSAT